MEHITIGTEKKGDGLLFDRSMYKVVKKTGVAGTVIPAHTHENEMVIITGLSGIVEVTLNGGELHTITTGTVLEFDGDYSVQPTFIEDGEFIVTLIKKA